MRVKCLGAVTVETNHSSAQGPRLAPACDVRPAASAQPFRITSPFRSPTRTRSSSFFRLSAFRDAQSKGIHVDLEHESAQPSQYLCRPRAGPRCPLILCLSTRAALPAGIASATPPRSPTDKSGMQETTAGELLSLAHSYQCRPRKSLNAANGGCRSFDDECDWQLPASPPIQECCLRQQHSHSRPRLPLHPPPLLPPFPEPCRSSELTI
ncbi:hypothetical protein DFH09DRAFT_1368500 [Mycena vulgaris]|nr:hypothetical protein DFH09DRAFT_1368500 [Mycena vulgaris]